MKKREVKFYRSRNLFTLITVLLSVSTLWGCSNSFTRSRALSTTVLPSSSPSVPGISLTISTVTITAADANGAPVTNVFFNTNNSTTNISNFCNTAGAGSAISAKACACQFRWNSTTASTSTNPTTGLPNPGTTIPHTVQMPVIGVQPALVGCNAPDLYSSEIPNGTKISISIVASANNPDGGTFTVPEFVYQKNTSAAPGSFADSLGNSFQNIMHYACHGLSKRGMAIQSKTTTLNNPTNGRSATTLFGSQFCVASSTGGTPDAQTCPNLPAATYSAQNYYYNMYIGASSVGNINLFNNSYYCPTVKESLGNNGTSGTQNKFWPMDSNFALSMGANTSFPVGVAANAYISVGGDPGSTTTVCQGLSNGASPTPAATPAAGQNAGSGIVQSCLGYAAAPSTDGTCPYFKNSSGQFQPTFRLRKYVALYPKMFEASGQTVNQPQPLDTIYVLDRPVQGPSSANPLQPYTMLGPKPCPLAYFDKKGVAQSNPSGADLPNYVASNYSGWRGIDGKGTNIDGIEFPNTDELNKSCSATFPVLNQAGQFSMLTVNAKNGTGTNRYGLGPAHVYVRPSQPFLAHYEEDTSFQACAPQATPFVDPPLHFSKDPVSGNVAWCAEYYPTQNDYLKELDPAPVNTPFASGNIPNYTSHVVKRSASQPCNASLPTITYLGPPSVSPAKYCYPGAPGVGGPGVNGACGTVPNVATSSYALHPSGIVWDSSCTGGYCNANSTCDRTVVANRTSASNSPDSWTQFPLLAPAREIEDSTFGIASDKSYQCTVTYDANSGKTGVNTPSSGCCNVSSVQVTTGNGVSGTNAHLEPDVPCKIPTY